MSFLASLFIDPSKAGNFEAKTAKLDNAVTTGQANSAMDQNNQSIQQQQSFAQALAGQNGIGNQSNVFNQLQGVANGTGPNPAQAQLAQATGANTANQAALMAGQRGAGANAGLIARQAAMQGAANQQNAAGQAATLQANQSLGALGQLGGIAGQQVAQQGQAIQGLGQMTAGNQNSLLNAVQGQNNAAISNVSQQNAANSGVAQVNAKSAGDMTGKLLGAAGSALGMAQGGEVEASPVVLTAVPHPALGDIDFGDKKDKADPSKVVKDASGKVVTGDAAKAAMALAQGGPVDQYGSLVQALKMAHGGKVPALVSPGERYLSPKEVEKVAKGEKAPMKAGEKIPGKAKVKGDKNSYANDTVPKQLEEGGIVLPRSVTQAKHPAWEAHKFISNIMKKKGSL